MLRLLRVNVSPGKEWGAGRNNKCPILQPAPCHDDVADERHGVLAHIEGGGIPSPKLLPLGP